MPMLIRTPEEIFRAERKDIYAIHNLEGKSRNTPGMALIEQWLKVNLPGTKMELLAPSEYSGMICGGINGTLRVDFTPEGLQQFCDRWEVDNASVDSRFQCYIRPYQEWFQEHGRFVPTMAKPNGIGLNVWWHTPKGVIHHQLDMEDATAKGLSRHPADSRDIWMHVVDMWPEIAKLDPQQLTYGRTGKRGSQYFASYTTLLRKDLDGYQPPTVEQIREWFLLPAEVEIREDDF